MKVFQHILLMVIVLTFSSVVTAQELKVVSFEKLLTDITARSTDIKDGNGDVCALIKVSLPVEGCEFAGNIVDKPKFHVSEYWVYMTPSSKKLIVRCPGCESLNADFGIAVESGVTYQLRLSGYSTVTGGSKNQPVTFKITPADAVLTIDQNEYPTQNGVAQIMLSPGEHTYAVFAPGYNVQGSKFMVYENNNNKIIVELEAKTQTAGNLQPVQTNVSASSNTINGHEYVDLGLPSGLKWATCNVGASSPSDYGNYFKWGKTTKDVSSWMTETMVIVVSSKKRKKKRGDISGNPEYDAACANWGGNWRLPSKKECEELESKCTWSWTTQGSHKGYKVTGPNGKSIFLPAASYIDNGIVTFNLSDPVGFYWSSTPAESESQCAYGLFFGSGYHYVDLNNRYHGQSVRPVSD